jgi:alpha-mannosidase
MEVKMKKKRIHLIANAHLDPVWLWRWEEGCTEALSTFQTAVDLMKEYGEFQFNHNEAILYEWVKENNPELFEKIKENVKNNRWEIMGGWYLQPDCNMPTGESMVRNIMLGRKFFKENFNAYPSTAINFDSFGHSMGLIQILNQAGYDNYLVYRPGQNNYDFKDADFVWEGFAGSKVTVHRSDEGYNSIWGEAANQLSKFLGERKDQEVSLFLWGVGDHGGGPTREDLDRLRELSQYSEYEIIHSNPRAYFEELRKTGKKLKRVNRGLNPVA